MLASRWEFPFMMMMLPTYLQKEALEWFRSSGMKADSWESLLKRMMNRFSSEAQLALWRAELINIRQKEGESVAAYADRLDILAEKVGEDNQVALVERFLGGLIRHVQQSMPIDKLRAPLQEVVA